MFLIVEYEFRSANGQKVKVKSRMGEEAARSAAMEYFWGPPEGWCQNRGVGLTLLSAQEQV